MSISKFLHGGGFAVILIGFPCFMGPPCFGYGLPESADIMAMGAFATFAGSVAVIIGAIFRIFNR